MSFAPAIASNMAMAFALALAAWLSARLARRPVVTHLLWVLALVKLLSPPLVGLPVLPAPEGARALRVSVVPAVLPAPPSPARLPPAGTLLGLPLASGAAVILGLAAIRARRFQRLLDDATPATASLQHRVAALAQRMGLARAPELCFIEARISPMVWPRSWRAFSLVFPRSLWNDLSEPERDALISHELAHLRRRDPWMRCVELASVSLFWWYPVSWWARAGLRRAEERCCDDLVMAHRPQSSRAYADGLVKTMAFLSQEHVPTPGLGTGADNLSELRERITAIMTTKNSHRLSPRGRALIALAAVFVLGTFLTRASGVSSADSAEQAGAEGDVQLELAREATAIQRQRLELQLRQLELERELTQARHLQEVELLREQAQRLRDEGQLEASREHDRQAERVAREAEHQRERFELEARRLREISRLELQLQEQEAAARSSEHRRDLERLQNEIYDARRAHLRQEQELRRRVVDDRLEMLERERALHEQRGRQSEAAMLELEMRRLAAEQELFEARLELHRKELELERREAEASRMR